MDGKHHRSPAVTIADLKTAENRLKERIIHNNSNTQVRIDREVVPGKSQANHHHDQKPFKTPNPQQVVSFGVPAADPGDQNIDSERDDNQQYLDQIISPISTIT